MTIGHFFDKALNFFIYTLRNFYSIGHFSDRSWPQEIQCMKKIKLPGSRFKVTSGIYLITCLVTKDTYVGKSKNLNQRWCQHRKSLKDGCHENPHLQELYTQHGAKNFTMELLELVPNIEELETKEVYWTEQKRPTLNVVNTRLSISDVRVIKDLISSGGSEEEVAGKFRLSVKYLREIMRGDKWKE